MPAQATVGALVGRATDCGEIDAMLERARGGRSSALLLRGEAGIGKTSLLRYAVGRSGGMQLLAARGIESESELPFSGLSELLRPLLGGLDGLPGRQAAALAGALALGPPTGADPGAVAAATLSLLAAAAADEPVLAVVDDLQWLDTSSAEALVFAARRLDLEAAALLFAERDGEGASHLDPGFPVRIVRGLDRVSSLELVATAAGRPVPDGVAERLFHETHGNPLALVEITKLLPVDLLDGDGTMDEVPLPAGERVGRAYARQVATLPQAIQDALLLAAANDAADVDPVLRALPAMGLGPRDLDAAEATGLIAATGIRLEFRHPLVRSAVYHRADAARRRAAHRALASGLSDAGEAFSARHAWHLAAATLGCDDEVAGALERAAVSARHRSGYAAAARTYERAGRLSSGLEARARRLFAAADAWQLANRYDHAMRLLDEAARLTSDRLLEADIAHLQARIDTWRGPAVDACERLRALAERLREISPGRAAAMLADATLAGITGGEIDRGLASAQLGYEIAAPLGGGIELLSALQLGKARILTGDVQHGYSLVMRAVELLDGDDPLAHGAELVQCVPALQTIEEYELAERILEHVIAPERAADAVGLLPYSLGARAELETRTGRWAPASADGAQAIQLAQEAGQNGQLSYNLARAARLEAAMGRDEACRESASRALALARQHNFGSTLPFAESGLGLLALGRGQLSQAILHLEETGRLCERIGLREPGRLEWQADLVEAYLRAGQVPEALNVLDDLERRARSCIRPGDDRRPATGCTLAHAAAARCRGLIADGHDVDARFEEALAWHAWTRTPFEQGRTELCFGEQLRRSGRRVEARRHLRAALATFEELGADPWTERARVELAATGETVAPRRMRRLITLTSQELQVALLVGGGATNREAAAALFLTPKTIEFHLAKIYRKLDLRSRTELARWVASQGPARA